MRTIPVNLYCFDELSGNAKEKALQELHFAAEYPWHDENRDTLKAIEKAFKLERFDWGYDACGSWFCFEVPHDLKQGLNRGRIALYLDFMRKDNPSIGDYYLMGFFKADFWKSFNQYGDIKQALNDAICEVIKACQKDMEDYFSEESLADHAVVNEYEFSEDGALA